MVYGKGKVFYNMCFMENKIAIALVFIILAVLGVNAETREPAVSGGFYPDNPDELRKMVSGFIDGAELGSITLPSGDLFGLICPHAGYIYSGPVAGYSYKILARQTAEYFITRGVGCAPIPEASFGVLTRRYKLLKGKKYDTVIILGPNHRAWGFNDVSVWNSGSFKTPLGEVPVDKEFADAIIGANPKKFIFYPAAHKEEHSIEAQLPFLQMVLGDFKIVPIVMGDFSQATCIELARAIVKNTGGKKVLIVASTDLSHDKTYSAAVDMDNLGLNYAVNMDIEKLITAEKEGRTEMCGYGPVLTLLDAAKEKQGVKGVFLKYANSGDTTGNKSGRIVGYGAAAFYSEGAAGKEGENMANNGGQYTLEEKKALLNLARGTITDYLSNGKSGGYPVFSKKFEEKRGVFVTLQEHGDLRGCIGYIEPIKQLQEAVIDNAKNAATSDPRFPPVNIKEVPDLEIEISVLTPPEEVAGAGDFIVGKHGIIIKKGIYSAVFLPQVAPEQGWTREETLRHLCQKAGLAQDEWQKPGMKFFVFTAEVFSEKEVK